MKICKFSKSKCLFDECEWWDSDLGACRVSGMIEGLQVSTTSTLKEFGIEW